MKKNLKNVNDENFQEASQKTKKYLQEASMCGIEIASCVITGVLLGLGLDRYFSSSPFLLILFFFFGIVAAYLNILKMFKRSQK